MTIDVDGLKARIDIVSVVGSYVSLKKRGAEYVGLCVSHNDSSPSMWVSPTKGFVHCFSCDFNADVIDFVMHMEKIDFKAACEKLGAVDNWTPKAPIKHEAKAKQAERITSKPPPDAQMPAMSIRGLGEPSQVWTYRDSEGGVLGYVARYETDEGKQIRCWSYGARGDAPPSWGCGHWSTPRPLYGLDRLAKRADPVVVVEGEKAADAAAKLLPAYIAITWPGGSNAWHRANWSPLSGRKVLLWPDNDKPGIEAMAKLAALIGDPQGMACSVKVIDPSGQPEGFDIADWTGTTEDLIAWAKPKATPYAAPQDSPPEPPAPPDDPPPSEDEDDDEALPAAMSEDMMADRFAERYGATWRYVRPWGSWYEWRGDGWYRDDTAKIDHLAVLHTRQANYWPEAAAITPDGKRRISSKRTAGSIRDIALSDRRIAATVNQWDTDPWLMGVPNGVVDLRTGKHATARPEDYITKRALVAPEPGEMPIWCQFLDTVTAGDADLIAFLQRWAGYCLTGETREQCLAFLYGTGQNGKGVFIRTLANILGDYAVASDADVFMEADHARHSTEMARLRGARLVTVDETDSSKRWNEKRIKRITGGGKIEARFMRQDDFEFVPQFKLLIAGNHKPQLRGVGKAIQRRIHLVPFTVTIPDSERDDKLVQKLEAEYPQILQWMIDGCATWTETGLVAPTQVLEATSRYIEGEDVIGEWLEERTEQRGETARPIAYKNYRNWVEGRGERAWSSKAFWAALEERGFICRKSVGTWQIEGLELKFIPSDEPMPGRYQD